MPFTRYVCERKEWEVEGEMKSEQRELSRKLNIATSNGMIFGQ
jgi:hypothetical protein